MSSLPLPSPNPFVLLGTLLFALAAAAGHRADPRLFRRLKQGFDGVRNGTAHGNPTDSVHDLAYSTLPGTAVDPAAYQTLGGSGSPTVADASSAQTFSGDAGLGGRAGGANQLAKAAPNGLDTLANGGSNGLNGHGFGTGQVGSADLSFGHDLLGQGSGHGGSVQPDVLGQHGPHPSDWHTGGPSGSEVASQQPVGGSLGGGNAGGELARMPYGSGGQLAQHGGLGTAHGSPGSASGVLGSAQGGLGGTHGADGLAHAPSLVPSADLASLPPVDLAALPPVDASTLADVGTAPASDAFSMVVSGLGYPWLAAGALAKASSDEPLTRAVCCPGCSRALANPQRFCGYCGEPLDRTLA